MLYKKYDLYEKYGDFDKYEKKPVFIYLFCHDDLDEGYRPIIYRDYLKDLMYELEQVFQREIIVELHYAIPGVTDFSYKTELGSERSSLDEFASRGATFAQENDLSYRHNYRYGLITQDGISSSVHGMAQVGGNFFLASVQGYQHIAHELGHTFNASHEHAEVTFGIPPTQTYMHEANNPLYAKDYRFSDVNRSRMADFLASVE
jgi:hypothetical protein